MENEVHEAGGIQTVPGHTDYIEELHKDYCPLSPNVQCFQNHDFSSVLPFCCCFLYLFLNDYLVFHGLAVSWFI